MNVRTGSEPLNTVFTPSLVEVYFLCIYMWCSHMAVAILLLHLVAQTVAAVVVLCIQHVNVFDLL